MAGEDETTKKAGPGDVPAIFATIHFRSADRPDGYTSEEIEDLNIEANRHIPELYDKLVAVRAARRSMEQGD